jgi:hypothetical protein
VENVLMECAQGGRSPTLLSEELPVGYLFGGTNLWVIPDKKSVFVGDQVCYLYGRRDDKTATIARDIARPSLSTMRSCVGDTANDDRASCLPEVQERILEPTTSAQDEAPVS